MYLTRNYQLRIQDMLFLSGEMCADKENLGDTIMFLQSIINGTNDYVSMKSILPWFKLRFPFQYEYSTEDDALFSNPGAQTKRNRVLERYAENSYTQLESGIKSCRQLQENIEVDLFVAIYEAFDELKLFFRRTGFCNSRRRPMHGSEINCLLQLLGLTLECDSQLVTVLLQSKRLTYTSLIRKFVNTYSELMQLHWGQLEVFAQEYRRYIKSYAHKILLLIELRKCCLQPIETRRTSCSCCNIFSFRVVQISRAQVKIFLDQLEDVFSQPVSNSDVLISYIRLLKNNRSFVVELLQQYPEKKNIIADLWKDLMPSDSVVSHDAINVFQLKKSRNNS